MTPEQRREAVRRLLEDDPTMGQRAIAKALGVSQKTVSRDVIELRTAKAWGVTQVSHGDSQPLSTSTDVELSQVSRGDALVARIRGEMAEQGGLIPTSTEEELLVTVKDLADRIELLQGIVAADGESRRLKDGSVRLHPGLGEIRLCETTLAKVVSGISTMAEPQVNRVKQRAAQTRWRAKNMADAARFRESHGGEA